MRLRRGFGQVVTLFIARLSSRLLVSARRQAVILSLGVARLRCVACRNLLQFGEAFVLRGADKCNCSVRGDDLCVTRESRAISFPSGIHRDCLITTRCELFAL